MQVAAGSDEVGYREVVATAAAAEMAVASRVPPSWALRGTEEDVVSLEGLEGWRKREAATAETAATAQNGRRLSQVQG